MKKQLFGVLITTLMVTFLSVSAMAADLTDTLALGEYNSLGKYEAIEDEIGDGYTWENNILTITEDMTITTTGSQTAAIMLPDGATLTSANGATLAIDSSAHGIWSQGNLTIDGVTVTIDSAGMYSAGIFADYRADDNKLSIINGADITVNSGRDGIFAMINIDIKDSTITAENATQYGIYTNRNTLSIDNSTVIVANNSYNACVYVDSFVGSFTISDSTVTATSTSGDAIRSNSLTISGDETVVTATGGNAGINNCAVTIEGGVVTASGTSYGLCVPSVSITGGEVYASGATAIYTWGELSAGDLFVLTKDSNDEYTNLQFVYSIVSAKLCDGNNSAFTDIKIGDYDGTIGELDLTGVTQDISNKFFIWDYDTENGNTLTINELGLELDGQLKLPSDTTIVTNGDLTAIVSIGEENDIIIYGEVTLENSISGNSLSFAPNSHLDLAPEGNDTYLDDFDTINWENAKITNRGILHLNADQCSPEQIAELNILGEGCVILSEYDGDGFWLGDKAYTNKGETMNLFTNNLYLDPDTTPVGHDYGYTWLKEDDVYHLRFNESESGKTILLGHLQIFDTVENAVIHVDDEMIVMGGIFHENGNLNITGEGTLAAIEIGNKRSFNGYVPNCEGTLTIDTDTEVYMLLGFGDVTINGELKAGLSSVGNMKINNGAKAEFDAMLMFGYTEEPSLELGSKIKLLDPSQGAYKTIFMEDENLGDDIDNIYFGTITKDGEDIMMEDNGTGNVANGITFGKKPSSGHIVTGVTSPAITEEAKITFEDIAETDWFYDAVLWAVENKITDGTSDTEFSPNADCTRAQAVSFLWNEAGKPIVEAENNFTDVADDAWYYDAVMWAVSENIVTGITDTEFAPDEICTRAQIVALLWRMAGEPAMTAENNFTDVEADAYYYDAVLWAVSEKIVEGTGETTFEPNESCTRAHIVTLMYRIAE